MFSCTGQHYLYTLCSVCTISQREIITTNDSVVTWMMRGSNKVMSERYRKIKGVHWNDLLHRSKNKLLAQSFASAPSVWTTAACQRTGVALGITCDGIWCLCVGEFWYCHTSSSWRFLNVTPCWGQVQRWDGLTSKVSCVYDDSGVETAYFLSALHALCVLVWKLLS